MTCPDVLVLSQLLDGELPERATVRTHVDTCATCLGWMHRAETATATAGRDARAADTASGPGCLTPSQVVGWLDPTAGVRERRTATGHLDTCPHCLGEVLAAARMMRQLTAGPAQPVPDVLARRVASRWADGSPAHSLTTLVLTVTRAGAQLVDRYVVAPFHDLVEIAHAVPALRATADVAALHFELRAEGTRIRTTVVPAGDGVGVTIVLADDEGAPLPAQRISLQRHGRAVFSARTDAAGQIALPTLERGVYEVSCPGVSAAFRMDLRATT